jgi:hypothetical protein
MKGVFRLVVVFMWCAAVAAAAGCRSHVEPSDDIAGDWRGAIVDSVSGTGTIDITVKRTGPALSGTWSATFDVNGEKRTGALSGTVIDSNVTLVFAYDPPMVCAGGGSIDSTMAFNGRLGASGWAGSYVTLTCSSVRTGTIDVTRR